MLLCFQFLDAEFTESFTKQSSLFLARSRDSLHQLFRLNDRMGSPLPQRERIQLRCRRGRRCGFDCQIRKIPWRRKWQPTPVPLPGKLHGQRSLDGLQSMGSQRVRRDWVTNTFTNTNTLRVRVRLCFPFYHQYLAKCSTQSLCSVCVFLVF